jgi:hypothetical protein
MCWNIETHFTVTIIIKILIQCRDLKGLPSFIKFSPFPFSFSAHYKTLWRIALWGYVLWIVLGSRNSELTPNSSLNFAFRRVIADFCYVITSSKRAKFSTAYLQFCPSNPLWSQWSFGWQGARHRRIRPCNSQVQNDTYMCISYLWGKV